MTLEQLRVFVAVAERLHVTQAASALHITQSTASAAIHALEARIGMPLFNRVGRSIELTDAGRTFLPEAKAILQRVAEADQLMAELAGLERGHLSLHASQTIAGYWLPNHIAGFRAQHPKIQIDLTIGNTAEAVKAVNEGEADLGFVEGEVESPLLIAAEVGADRLLLVAGAANPPADVAKPADLFSLNWVLREAGSGTRQVFEDAIRAYGIDPFDLKVTL